MFYHDFYRPWPQLDLLLSFLLPLFPGKQLNPELSKRGQGLSLFAMQPGLEISKGTFLDQSNREPGKTSPHLCPWLCKATPGWLFIWAGA